MDRVYTMHGLVSKTKPRSTTGYLGHDFLKSVGVPRAELSIPAQCSS